MLRRLPAAYSDGVYEPSGANRPSPIAISEAVMSGPTGKRSERDRTAFLVFFGKRQSPNTHFSFQGYCLQTKLDTLFSGLYNSNE